MPNSPQERAVAMPLWVMGITLQVALVAATVLLTRLAEQPWIGGWTLLVLLASFVPYLLAVARTNRVPPQVVLRGIVIFAIVFRVTALCGPAVLSNDVVRSLWEGRAQTFGFNPYLVTPASPKAARLAPELLSRLAAPDMPATAAPLTEMAFRVGAVIWPHGPAMIKFMFAVLDLAVVWVLIRLLRLRGLPESAVLIYAWNPLVLLEFSSNGHPAPMAMFLALAAIYLVAPPPKKRWAGAFEQAVASLSLGGAVISHYLAAPLLLFMGRQIKLRFWLLWALVVAVFWLPFRDAGWHLFDGVVRVGMESRFHFNGSLFNGVAWLAGGNSWAGISAPLLVVAGACLLLLVVLLVLRPDPVRALYWLGGAWLLLSPVVEPWHVAWIVPFLCFFQNTGWLLLSASVLVSYVTRLVELQTGFRAESLELKLAEYLPAFVLMGWSTISPYVVPALKHEVKRGRM
ncbi:MAG: hypothetical protein HZA91_05335 [Verrucomicrobia bacterium]|nr:hypothetical protein [Verrucomicrobiota bacterium]